MCVAPMVNDHDEGGCERNLRQHCASQLNRAPVTYLLSCSINAFVRTSNSAPSGPSDQPKSGIM
jgi:hypothetical protein